MKFLPVRCTDLAVALVLSLASAAQGATISAVSPQGEVSLVQQVVVKFSESVVPLGDGRQGDPVTLIDPGAAKKAKAKKKQP